MIRAGDRLLRPEPASIPTAPGCYRFVGAGGEVLYVGKARNLRARLGSYFTVVGKLHPRTRLMLAQAATVDWVQVSSEADALQLEWTLVHRHRPRFNIKLQDDRRYPELALTAGQVPRVLVTRTARRKGERRFGPYRSAREARTLLDAALRVFPVRSCDQPAFERAVRSGRPCLLAELGRCAAPCVDRIGADEHRKLADGLARFLSGQVDSTLENLERQMLAASDARAFELAAKLRDQLDAARTAVAPLEVVWPSGGSASAVAVAVEGDRAAVTVLDVRSGRLTGRHQWLLDLSGVIVPADEWAMEAAVRDDDTGDDDTGADDTNAGDTGAVGRAGGYAPEACRMLVAEGLVRRFVATGDPLPPLLVVPEAPPEALVELLQRRRREDRASAQLKVMTPHRGRARVLLDLAQTNADAALRADTLRLRRQRTERVQALEQLAAICGLPSPPTRIEGYDISHFGGTGTVGSMVVFVDGLPSRQAYRRFVIGTSQNDDLASMHETVLRRLRRLADGDAAFTPPPDLLLIDGGPLQLDAALRAAAAAGFSGLPMVALAKQKEELWFPGRPDAVAPDPDSLPMLLLRHLRDEAHRSALRAQRSRRKADLLDARPARVTPRATQSDVSPGGGADER